jgi:hypothetical protein
VRKKPLLIAAFISALLFSAMTGTKLVSLTTADPLINQKPGYDIVSIHTPQNSTYYSNSNIYLNFTVRTNFHVSYLDWCYQLDGNATVLYGEVWSEMLKVEQRVIGQIVISDDFSGLGDEPYLPYTEYTIECNSVLPPLSDGLHNLTVYRGPNYQFRGAYYTPFSTVYFNVGTSPTETPSQEPASSPETQTEPFPTTLVVAASGVSITVVAVCSLYYYKRRNH